jgi:hypothetical protein
MGIDRPGCHPPHLQPARSPLGVELDYPRLREVTYDLRTAACCVEATAALARYLAYMIRVSSRPADGNFYPSDKRPCAPTDASSPAAGAPGADEKIIVVIGGHPQDIDGPDAPRNALQRPTVTQRNFACCGLVAADSLTPCATPPSVGTLKANQKREERRRAALVG